MHIRVREFRSTHPPSTASPSGRINLQVEPSQATASKHRSPHSVRVTVTVTVKVRRHGEKPLFERSESLVATSKKKNCVSVRLILVLVGGRKTAVVVARYDSSMIPGTYYVPDTYVPHLPLYY